MHEKKRMHIGTGGAGKTAVLGILRRKNSKSGSKVRQGVPNVRCLASAFPFDARGTRAMTMEEKSEEEARAADSLALKWDAAASLLTEPSWPPSRVLMWIAFRELARIGDDW